jgi:hypothetical protein
MTFPCWQFTTATKWAKQRWWWWQKKAMGRQGSSYKNNIWNTKSKEQRAQTNDQRCKDHRCIGNRHSCKGVSQEWSGWYKKLINDSCKAKEINVLESWRVEERDSERSTSTVSGPCSALSTTSTNVYYILLYTSSSNVLYTYVAHVRRRI